MQIFRKIKEVVLAVCMICILGLTYNAFANSHVHILSNGFVINHAHPFSDTADTNSPDPVNNHSDSEYIFLDQINLQYIMPILFILAFIFISVSKKTTLIVHEEQLVPLTVPIQIKGRAPPFKF